MDATQHSNRRVAVPRFREAAATLVLAVVLQAALIRRTQGEDRLDGKFMYYQEANDRIQVLTPTVMYQKELSPTLTIKVDGIYNAISGASPTGAPPVAKTRSETRTITVPGSTTRTTSTAAVGEDEDSRDDDDDHERSGIVTSSPAAFSGFSGATARVSTPTSSGPSSGSSSTRTETIQVPTGEVEIPVAEVDDTRVGGNIALIKRLDEHTLSGLLSYSGESDYQSFGVGFTHAIDFNLKNTTLLWGLAVTHDSVDKFYEPGTETKDSIDAIIGVTQVLDPRTLLTVNFSLGYVTGYLNDPYKVVELNGVLVPEQRPDNKTKEIVYVSLTRHIESLKGSLETSYRFYNDSFGITANTVGLAWYQRLGEKFILRPSVRFYDQEGSDFYDVRFAGNPSDYSSDYRLSALTTMSYGLKLIWFTRSDLSLDVAYERYDQEGKDSETADEVYPTADMVTVGASLWF